MSGGNYLAHLMSILQETNNQFYLIRRIHEDKDWFFFDLESDTNPHQVLWVPYPSLAFKFSSEESVEDFRMDFLNPRQTEIVRFTKND